MVVAEGFQVPCVTIKGEFVERADSFFFIFFIWQSPAGDDEKHIHVEVSAFLFACE